MPALLHHVAPHAPSAFPVPLLAMITWPVMLLALGFVLVCLLMMLVILVQKPKGGGLSGAFGGAGGGESSFVGAKVGDVLTLFTVGCFIAFLLLAMGLNWTINPIENRAKNASLLETSSQDTPPLDTADTAPTSDTPATDGDDLANQTAAGLGADLAATVADDNENQDTPAPDAEPAPTPSPEPAP